MQRAQRVRYIYRVDAGNPTRELRLQIEGAGEVSAILVRPPKAHRLLVLAHGAGAGMHHPFLEALTRELADAGVASFRYQFPYMEQRRRLPDGPGVLTATVRTAASAAAEAAPELPLLAGGKSLGGRMTSLAASQEPFEKVQGLVFFGFPLHPPNRPGTKRAEHLPRVNVPMLFLQGTRDAFASLELLRPICAELGSRAALRVFETADHSFHVLKNSGRTDIEVMHELAQAVAYWTPSGRTAP
jgi:predicted alpha/beta-hydrolase family hydrolase